MLNLKLIQIIVDHDHADHNLSSVSLHVLLKQGHINSNEHQLAVADNGLFAMDERLAKLLRIRRLRRKGGRGE